jgi:replicative DNA helicase
MVIFLYREEYYNREDPTDADGNSLKGLAEIIIEKHRNGETDTVLARFIGQYIKYCNYDDNAIHYDNTNFSPASMNENVYESRSSNVVKTMGSKMNDEDFMGDTPF